MSLQTWSQNTRNNFNVNIWIVDKAHFYFGPASGTTAGGVGVLGVNCSCMAGDLNKLFLAYWYLAGLPSNQHATQPKVLFPAAAITTINHSRRLIVPASSDNSGINYHPNTPLTNSVFISVRINRYTYQRPKE